MKLTVFLFGTLLIGLLTGFLTGASATPVVSVVLPLLFSAATAGGVVFVVWGKRGEDQGTTKKERGERCLFLGSQGISYAVGFLFGIWLGAFTKYRPEVVWKLPIERVAYSEISFEHPSQFLIISQIDHRMIADGVDFSKRNAILGDLNKALISLSQADRTLPTFAPNQMSPPSASKTGDGLFQKPMTPEQKQVLSSPVYERLLKEMKEHGGQMPDNQMMRRLGISFPLPHLDADKPPIPPRP